MKLVFTELEVAAALQKSPAEFAILRPALERLGFPKPLRGIEDRWSIMDVISWVQSSSDYDGLPTGIGNGFAEGKMKFS